VKNFDVQKIKMYLDDRSGKVAIKGEIRNLATKDFSAVHFTVIVRREAVGVAIATIAVYGLARGQCKPFDKALDDLQKGPIGLRLNFTPKFECEILEAY